MIYFIINPLAGGGNGNSAKSVIEDILKDCPLEYKLYESKYQGHAIELARELSNLPDCTGLVAVGGDGTFSEVLNGMNTAVPLGLIPCGTGNDFACGAGISKDISNALQAITSGNTAPMDFITVGDRRCLNITGTGFDVDILAREARYRKKLKTKYTYYLALIATIFSIKFRRLKAVIDDQTVIDRDILIMVAANGRFFGGGMPMVPSAVTNDGIMDVLIVKKVPYIVIPKLLICFLKGNIEEQTKYVDIYRCKKVSCEVEGSTDIEVDGEVVSLLPAEIKIHSGELRVFCKESI
ncbi:MAG: diacylglycerol kinase family lipid kinase [Clostridia bacterium]|nr:diacylglycerol kinase family lipid kinase [Clostridia bacterium]